MEKLYKFHWDCGRCGDVRSVFIADDSAVSKAIGEDVYFGEILGKHSEVSGILEEKDLTVVSEDEGFIEKLLSVFGSKTISGYNPLSYLHEEESDEEEE